LEDDRCASLRPWFLPAARLDLMDASPAMTTATAHHRYFAGLSRNTFLLALASLFADISTEMLYPILPIFLTQTLKASGSVVGLIEGVAGATQNIVQGFSGALSDKLQRRKPVALVGYFLAALGKPLMGAATVWQGVLGAFPGPAGRRHPLRPARCSHCLFSGRSEPRQGLRARRRRR